MYELLYILFYYCILLSFLYCYKRHISPDYRQPLRREEEQNRVEYDYKEIEMEGFHQTPNYHMY